MAFSIWTQSTTGGNGSNFVLTTNPPLQFTPIQYYGNFSSISPSNSVTFPSATIYGFDKNLKDPTTMNVNFGVQQKTVFGTVLDVSYVATLGRHLLDSINRNAEPYGSNFLPANQDPTLPGVALSPNFFRPYPGYGNITYYQSAANSSYHALQVTLNKRYARSLTFGVSYTWSKALDYTDTDGGAVSNFISPKIWNYGLASFDRTQNLVANWVWTIPNGSKMWNTGLGKALLDNWQLSGVATFQGGAPLAINYTLVNSVDITGSVTESSRVNVIANPNIPSSHRTFYQNFNTNAFAPPSVGTSGNAAKVVIRGPGIEDWDLALFRSFALSKERVRAQLRWETYNTFNHTQFSGLDTNARFDPTGKQVSQSFGSYTTAYDPRTMQVALKIVF